MSIPYNEGISIEVFRGHATYQALYTFPNGNPVKRAAIEAITNLFKEPVVRGVQLLRDTARLVLKVPIRAVVKPIFLEKNWRELERAKVNVKLTGYAFIQLVSVPAKFAVALTALAISVFSHEKAEGLLNMSRKWTIYLDGRASQLEALKEEGAKKSIDREEFEDYRNWLYHIQPLNCIKQY